MREYSYDDKNRLFISFIVKAGSKRYASNAESNGLFEILDDNTANFITVFPKEKMHKYFLFSDYICIEDYLIFVPGSAEHIHIFDLQTKSFHIVDFKLDVEHNGYLEAFKFIGVKETEEFVYFLPNTYPAIIRMRKKTWEITYINQWVPKEQFRFRRGHVDYNSVIYTVSQNSNMLFVFDYHKESVQVVKYDDDVIGGMALCVDENYAWIATASNISQVLKVDLRNGAVVEKNVYLNEHGEFENAFSYAFLSDGKKCFCPKGVKKMLVLGQNGELWKEIPNLTTPNQDLYLMHKTSDELLFYRKNTKDKYGVQSEHCAVIFNLNTMEAKECIFTVNNWKEYKDILLEVINESNVFYENSLLGLNEIRFLTNETTEVSITENCGEKIYRALMNLQEGNRE